jgi:RNA polymerase sigma-70 factor (ECF subfamily)
MSQTVDNSDGHTPSSKGDLDPERWIQEHGDYLFDLAFLRLHDRSAAEDAVQETFLGALKARPGFQGRAAERTWLVAILKRKIVDHLRRRFREAAPEADEQLPDDHLEGFQSDGEWVGHWFPRRGPVDWTDNPLALLEKKEFWEILESCLAKLPPRMASVFALYEIDEMPSEEICKELGISPTNLWVLLHRARHRLRACLESNWLGAGKPGPK